MAAVVGSTCVQTLDSQINTHFPQNDLGYNPHILLVPVDKDLRGRGVQREPRASLLISQTIPRPLITFVYDPSSQASSWPGVTFFDLSRELRDYCYSLALTSPTPIIVWSGIAPENSNLIGAKAKFEGEVKTAIESKTATSDMRNTVSNLLQCNSIILYEAASIFYRKDKNVFACDWTWKTVATWYGNIDLRNRTFVTSIELWQHQPSHTWQTVSGERVQVHEFDWDPLEPPFPRNRYLYRSPDSTSQGLVETINPAIETFFRLLSNERPSKLLLTISLEKSLLPGLEGDFLGEDSPEYWFSMDLPNVIEKLHAIYTAGSVDVIWKGQFQRPEFLKKQEIIEGHWAILELEEFDQTYNTRSGHKDELLYAAYLKEERTP